MPNHCDSDLIIRGTRGDIEKCLEEYFTPDGELDCNRVTPYPARFKQKDEAAENWDKEYHLVVSDKAPGSRPTDGYNSGGYEWCIENWGTKWGTYGGRGITYTKSSARLSFFSAWSSPLPALDKLATLCPTLVFILRSYESGNAWKRHAVWKNGARIVDVVQDYNGTRGG